ncbi:hypothetical protein BLOT_006970, partial [Blomia tropicalis]
MIVVDVRQHYSKHGAAALWKRLNRHSSNKIVVMPIKFNISFYTLLANKIGNSISMVRLRNFNSIHLIRQTKGNEEFNSG